MRIIRNDKQKDNLAKVFWDMGKVPLTFQKLRMLQILGDEGEAVVLYRKPSTTQEAWYPRLSHRVNNMAVFPYFQDFTYRAF